jgi:tRNA(fMet)-specific endonuclease VapC
MTVFDTDVFVEILAGNGRFVERAAAVPSDQQSIAVVTVEEIMRGRLHVIRQAEAGKGRITLGRAYELLSRSVNDFHRPTILPYTGGADLLFRGWREQRIRVSTHDLWIAAICEDHGATLASRNRRDFERVPGLSVEFWE